MEPRLVVVPDPLRATISFLEREALEEEEEASKEIRSYLYALERGIYIYFKEPLTFLEEIFPLVITIILTEVPIDLGKGRWTIQKEEEEEKTIAQTKKEEEATIWLFLTISILPSEVNIMTMTIPFLLVMEAVSIAPRLLGASKV